MTTERRCIALKTEVTDIYSMINHIIGPDQVKRPERITPLIYISPLINTGIREIPPGKTSFTQSVFNRRIPFCSHFVNGYFGESVLD